MNYRTMTVLTAVACCLSQRVEAQTIETQKKPPAVVFKDAPGTVVTSIPIDRKLGVPIVEMKVSVSSNMAYVLTGSGKSMSKPKSRQLSLSAVNLATQRVDRVISIGQGNEAELQISPDGRRLFSQSLKNVYEGNGRLAIEHFQKRDGSGSVITAIDTSSNQVIGSYDLLNNPAAALPKFRFIETFFSVTADGERILAKVDGFEGRVVRTGSPSWVRLLVFSTTSPNSVSMIDPGAPIVSCKFSQDGKFLFVAAEDKARRSEVVEIVNLQKGTTLNRVLDNPPTRRERLGAFLEGAPPSGMESMHGIWVFTRGGLRFISETGEMGQEIALPVEDNVFAKLSLDSTLFFLIVPGGNQHSGMLHVVDLKKGASSSHPLADVPTGLIRLGTANGLWIAGSREMRSVSETGELGEQPILLNKPRKMEGGDADSADVFLDGYPGETITVGEDHAAILIAKKKGGSLHRVALIDLKKLQVDSIVTTMSKGEQSKIITGRWLETMAVVALGGAMRGVLVLPEGLANEFLAARSDGTTLYVLDTDIHKVSVIDIQSATVSARIPVNNSVTTIQVAQDGKHLLCAGPGFLQAVDLESSKMTN
jgi:DNA-binding beta-propeller fold protein YncE